MGVDSGGVIGDSRTHSVGHLYGLASSPKQSSNTHCSHSLDELVIYTPDSISLVTSRLNRSSTELTLHATLPCLQALIVHRCSGPKVLGLYYHHYELDVSSRDYSKRSFSWQAMDIPGSP